MPLVSHAIVGGDSADAPGSPFPSSSRGPLVALFVNGYHHCSGVVIAKNKIATARHCLSELSSPLDLRFGTDAYSAPSVSRNIRTIIQSPASPNSRQGDLAIITLQENLEGVQAAKLPQDAESPGMRLIISGYGCPDMFGSPPGQLRFASVRTMGVSSTMITFPSTPETGAFPSLCQGDSGGGTFMQNEQGELILVGINSSIGFAGDFSAGMGKVYRLSGAIIEEMELVPTFSPEITDSCSLPSYGVPTQEKQLKKELDAITNSFMQ